jgi:hypothetical protein
MTTKGEAKATTTATADPLRDDNQNATAMAKQKQVLRLAAKDDN